ncbi:FecR family protein [Thermoflexibacter ruber]|uniref:Ferric-dicitrate binding protein FerR, regulates iron transport through sigma-19 n=1 Tax=Thermoflexibacter ruber TaxID=1003 RepID=A0A1I2G8D0_9BACT|nr:FecR domain-containing protein [Thermoflexibacter ruber]SFF13413.1 ferric-dicitrate binding protein FerR, regulates iron transport through sigma-19 [Thermoflexibacter ruber]
MTTNNYQNYSLEDFLEDKYFRDWVKCPNEQTDEFWKSMQKQSPEKEAMIAQARLILLGFMVEEEVVSKENIDLLWQKVQQKQKLSVFYKNSQRPLFSKPSARMYSVAASLALLMVVSIVFWYNYIRFVPIVYQTKYGQMQTIVLPDGSKVMLNANSRLEIHKEWKETESRELSLVGEAFFEVEKKPATEQKFIVHTADLDVVVLGTSFNVSDRYAKTKVVLKEGAVTLKLNNKQGVRNEQEIVMQVGEMVEFSKKENKLVKQKVNAERYASWKENKLIFEDTPMREIALLIQENYGLEVSFEDESLAKRKITGTIPSQNLQILLSSLETIFDVKITQKNEKLILGK